jgi:hypothetical protein
MWFNIWIVGTLISMPLLAEERGKLQSPIGCMFWPLIWPILGIAMLCDWLNAGHHWSLSGHEAKEKDNQ